MKLLYNNKTATFGNGFNEIISEDYPKLIEGTISKSEDGYINKYEAYYIQRKSDRNKALAKQGDLISSEYLGAYVKPTARYQAFRTNYVPNSSTKIEMTFDAQNTGCMLFGAFTGELTSSKYEWWRNYNFGIKIDNNAKKTNLYFGAPYDYAFSISNVGKQTFTIDYPNQVATFNGSSKTITVSSSTTYPDVPLYIGNWDWNNTILCTNLTDAPQSTNLLIYSFKIYENDVLIADLEPALTENGVTLINITEGSTITVEPISKPNSNFSVDAVTDGIKVDYSAFTTNISA